MVKPFFNSRVVVPSESARLAAELCFGLGFAFMIVSAFLSWAWLIWRAAASALPSMVEAAWETKELNLESNLAGLCALAFLFIAAQVLPHRRREMPRNDDSDCNAGGHGSENPNGDVNANRNTFLNYSPRPDLWERFDRAWGYYPIRLAFTAIVIASLLAVPTLLGSIFHRAPG